MTTVTADAVNAKEKLIVALDVDSADEARRLFERLREDAGMFKVGSRLFTSAGPDFVRGLVREGARVFLDLKFHDIPNTVAGACREAVRLGVALFNVHAAGGGEMLRRASEATSEEAARLGVSKPSLIAVTVLTSADARTLEETGVSAESVEAQVRRLARLADSSGLDGVVASPHEIAVVRGAVARSPFLVVTPGVHPTAAAYEDQKRVMSPSEAVRAGADFIVVGRAILKSEDPAAAARAVVEEMGRA
ncbi:MAG TPA: orotidine-5'-phosphate decarboxylase [Pyrinomonadaceae bacterium]|jgi:orotidine-5'-phosphate decarboxylase|nr:orotidine-5'-phosphate decarboxylase [Pyrinomonadaceae bacterium]